MHSFLIIAPTLKAREDYIRTRTASLGIGHFDEVIATSETGGIGVADIRTFIKRLTLKPQQGTKVAGIIANSELLTPEAQQALLKTLEEPPKGVLLFLGAANTSQLLPTILSRCETIRLDGSDTGFSLQDFERIKADIGELLTLTKGNRIARIAHIGKTKEDIFRWIDGAILMLRTTLLERVHTPRPADKEVVRYRFLLSALLRAKKFEKNNVHPLLFVEQGFLTLP